MDTVSDIEGRINHLRLKGKKREEIAEELGISMARLKRLIAGLVIVPRLTKAELKKSEPKQRIREKPVYADPEDGEGLMDRAKVILGARMGEKYGSYTLDGLPVSSWAILKAAGLSTR